jgi:carbon-monoxide dehydrogenase medium subunit
VTLEQFALEVPHDVPTALALLDEHGDAATLFLGGTELVLLMKLGLAEPDLMVDGKRLPELLGIRVVDGGLDIGAGCTHREIEASPDVRRLLPAYARLSARVGNPRVRNTGTLGGNLCFAEPHSDPATLLYALDAAVELASTGGSRRVAVGDFLLGPLQTALDAGEIMTRVHVPVPDPATARVAFERIAFHERPVVNAAVVADGSQVRVVVGAVGGRPQRVAAAEQLVGEQAPMADIAAAVAEGVEPLDDAQGSIEYKRHLAGVAVGRCLRRIRLG